MDPFAPTAQATLVAAIFRGPELLSLGERTVAALCAAVTTRQPKKGSRSGAVSCY